MLLYTAEDLADWCCATAHLASSSSLPGVWEVRLSQDDLRMLTGG